MCHSQLEEREKFIDTIKQLGNTAILLKIHDDGKPEAVFISPDYIKMMEENSLEEASRYNSTGNFFEIIYPEDRPLVEYMLKNHEAPDKSKTIQFRKVTFNKNIIWCEAHYAFLNVSNENYVYINL